MARILISENHEHVRRLLERMVTRLGHDPVLVTIPDPGQLSSADVLIVEPASPIGAVLAQAAAIARPELPLVCASVEPPPGELAELGVSFAGTLVKPFTIGQLERALTGALGNAEPDTAA
jgi:hypothetical protein